MKDILGTLLFAGCLLILTSVSVTVALGFTLVIMLLVGV